jgi:hypothetical protein
VLYNQNSVIKKYISIVKNTSVQIGRMMVENLLGLRLNDTMDNQTIDSHTLQIVQQRIFDQAKQHFFSKIKFKKSRNCSIYKYTYQINLINEL